VPIRADHALACIFSSMCSRLLLLLVFASGCLVTRRLRVACCVAQHCLEGQNLQHSSQDRCRHRMLEQRHQRWQWPAQSQLHAWAHHTLRNHCSSKHSISNHCSSKDPAAGAPGLPSALTFCSISRFSCCRRSSSSTFQSWPMLAACRPPVALAALAAGWLELHQACFMAQAMTCQQPQRRLQGCCEEKERRPQLTSLQAPGEPVTPSTAAAAAALLAASSCCTWCSCSCRPCSCCCSCSLSAARASRWRTAAPRSSRACKGNAHHANVAHTAEPPPPGTTSGIGHMQAACAQPAAALVLDGDAAHLVQLSFQCRLLSVPGLPVQHQLPGSFRGAGHGRRLPLCHGLRLRLLLLQQLLYLLAVLLGQLLQLRVSSCRCTAQCNAISKHVTRHGRCMCRRMESAL